MASKMYIDGVDIIFATAGLSGFGVIEEISNEDYAPSTEKA